MKTATRYHCEVCGTTQKNHGWFLVSEDKERNTLQILTWSSRLADHPGMRHLCSAAHVEELVSHWMVDDTLDYGCRPEDTASAPLAADMDESYRLGELMLDRSSFAALGERPDMLSSILDAIDGALQASDGARSLLEEEEEEEAAVQLYDS